MNNLAVLSSTQHLPIGAEFLVKNLGSRHGPALIFVFNSGAFTFCF